MGHEVLPQAGRGLEMEPSDASQEVCGHGGEHLDGILSYCDRKVPLGYVESTNQKVKNVIRRAYGYRDKEFKKLKIIQACTPWMNEFKPWSRYP